MLRALFTGARPIQCTAAAADCDVLLTVGTSLQVWPAAGLADVAVRSGARLVVVNAQ